MLAAVTMFASNRETRARTMDQLVAVGKRLRVAKSFAHVQAVAVCTNFGSI